MRKTWIAVLTGTLSVWSSGALADDASTVKTPWKVTLPGLAKAKTTQPPEKVPAPKPEGPETIPAPKPEGAASPATPAPTAPTVAELAPYSAPVGTGTCASNACPCGPSHWERLKAWACFHSTSGKVCADCCCGGQRWVPIYLFFLTPSCREGCGPVCGAACGPTCGLCAAPCQPACKAPSAPTITPCKAVTPAPSASPATKTSCDTPCGFVTPKKDGCSGSCGPVSGSCGSSWFLADFAHRMFSPSCGINGR